MCLCPTQLLAYSFSASIRGSCEQVFLMSNQVPSTFPINLNNIILKSAFFKENFNFLHINPGSLKPHIDDLRSLTHNVSLHAIAVSESWFNGKINDRLVAIENFSLLRHDRLIKRGGGVAIYIRNGLKAKVIRKSRSNSKTEYLFIEIINKFSEKLCFGVIYNPPNNFLSDSLKSVLSDLSLQSSNLIIAGDFNINVLKNSPSSNKFLKFISSISLSLCSNEPTNFVIGKTPSQIDYFLVKNKHLIKSCSQFSFGSFTSHDLIFGSYYYNLSSSIDSTKKTFRNFNRIIDDDLICKAFELVLDEIYTLPSIDDQVYLLTNFIKVLMDIFAPLKTCKVVKNFSSPWFSKELLNLINQRNFHHHLFSSEKNPSQKLFYKSQFKKLRNRVTNLKKSLKRDWFLSKLDVDLPARTLWNNIRNFGIVKSRNNSVESFSPLEFNDYFASVFSPHTSHNVTLKKDPSRNSFAFSTVENLDIKEAILSFKTNACGHDEIPNIFIKKLIPFITPFITYIINNCITKSYFPLSWKNGIVIPIPKKSNPCYVDDFRPISILPSLSKILERILKDQIQVYLDRNDLLYKFQSGIRNNLNTNSAMLKVVHDLGLAIEEDKLSIICFLDLKKAFDLVDHKTLILKLQDKFNFSFTACSLIKSYLSERKQQVYINNCLSPSIDVSSGTPQGGILSALLFTLFINDIPSDDVNVHLYADDSQIYYSTPINQIVSCSSKINQTLSLISAWAQLNHITVNPSKSMAMVVSNRKIVSPPPIIFDGKVIPYVEKVRSLGLILNNSLTFDDHISKLCGEISHCIGMLSQSKSFTPFNTRLKLFQALVMPKFLYLSNTYHNCSRKCWDLINITYNKCARYVFNIHLFSSVSQFSFKLLNCSLENFLKFRSCLYIYNLLKFKYPKYLYELLSFPKLQRNKMLNPPKSFRTTQFRSSFFVEGIKLWNSLDADIRNLESTMVFKRECLHYFASRMG